MAKAVRYIESHDRDQVLKIYDAWLKDNGYSDYVEAVDQNWGGSTGVASKKTADISDSDISLWLDWLTDRGDVDPSKIQPSDVYTNDYNDLANEGLTDECTDRPRRRRPGVPGEGRQGQAAS